MAGDAIVTIGTRGSPLALAQAYETKRLLGVHFPELAKEGAVEIKKIMTKGDSILNQALSEIGGKGLFTKELDVALLDKSVDICVHSMKDVPTWLPDGTVLPCNLIREETNDVFISKKYKTLKDLPNGAVIGSASLRRQAQLMAMNPTLKVTRAVPYLPPRLGRESHHTPLPCLALSGRQLPWQRADAPEEDRERRGGRDAAGARGAQAPGHDGRDRRGADHRLGRDAAGRRPGDPS